MKVQVDKDGFLDIQLFKDILDISKVVYYEIEQVEEGIILRFLDKDKKLIKG